ncbi:MAG: hypothetical protein IRY99_27805, partial [Isosphaeraceae bacterium]|nr:hypothetical protein [Isosphaeraceae bacterium]
MDGPDPAALFAGDLDDPWVAAIAASLPRDALRLPCAGDLPEQLPPEAGAVRTIVLHRAHLTNGDAGRLRRWLSHRDDPPRVVLCVGPHTRYQAIEQWSALVDVILPEATASETVARHLADFEAEPRLSAASVAVISDHYELCLVLAESCRAAGYRVEPARDWSEVGPAGLAVWDVPVLEADWPATLERAARSRRVVALLGFADRATVAEARARGAAACLNLPCDPADLAFVLD